MIKVVIVEDNETIRTGLREFIDDTEEFECVADYSRCEDLLENLTTLHPDIVLMDIDLPGISGIEGIKEIRKIVDNQKIIILTIYSESENLFEALLAGAHGYLEKKTPPSQMLQFLSAVYRDKSNMNTYIARKVLNTFGSKIFSSSNSIVVLNNIENVILKNLINGRSPKAIADELKVPSSKILGYFYKIYEKMHSRFQEEKPTLT